MSELDFDDNRTLFRAVFAGIALHGIVSKGLYGKGSEEEAAKTAVEIADAVMEELENDDPKEEGVAALQKTRRKYK